MKTPLFSFLLLLVYFCFRVIVITQAGAVHGHKDGCKSSGGVDSCNISIILTNILKGYDKRLRPFLNEGRPATITVGMWILSIDSINVINMDYRIDLFFRQAWVDPRLKHSYSESLTLENSMLSKLWVPDTYFENSKSSNFHFVTVPNKMLRISQNGSVDYNSRISLRASCPMDLRNFPVDVQVCHLHIESYGYDVRNIKYEWEADRGKRVNIAKKFQNLPQYNITNLDTSWMLSEYVIGNWSTLKFHFSLVRQSGHFFLHLYAPCILIVMLSWIAFFIPVDSIAARIALGITSVLTTTTILNIQNNSMPKVSYIKLADWYLIVCFLFVFGTLLEFTVILFINAKEKRKELKKTEAKKARMKASSRKGGTPGDNNSLFTGTATDGGYGVNPPIALLVEKQEHNRERMDSESVTSQSTEREARCRNFKVYHIDDYARIMFPVSFLIFNIIYWFIFLTKKNQAHDAQ